MTELKDCKTREEVLAWLESSPAPRAMVMGDFSENRAKALAHMERIALERAALVCNEMGADEQRSFGLKRQTQNYFRARNAIRNLINKESKNESV